MGLTICPMVLALLQTQCKSLSTASTSHSKMCIIFEGFEGVGGEGVANEKHHASAQILQISHQINNYKLIFSLNYLMTDLFLYDLWALTMWYQSMTATDGRIQERWKMFAEQTRMTNECHSGKISTLNISIPQILPLTIKIHFYS